MNKRFENLKNGEYLLTVDLKANSFTSASLYSNHRHFLLRDFPLREGDAFTFEFAVAIKDADFQKQGNYRDTALSLFWEGDCEMEFTLEKKSLPVIYTLGDSTVCNQEHWGKGPMFRCAGWGQALPLYFTNKYAVSNHAEQGTHTADCLSCHLIPVLNQLKKGDMVLCQFGHNDQKQEFLKPFEGYMENIITIGKKVMEKGADFVVCTPINRLIYIDGKINNYLDLWRDGAKRAAEALGVQCIDLHTFTTDAFLKMGKDAEKLFCHSPELDCSHTNDHGAMKIAAFISKEAKK